jgi:hypothetical protein
MSVLSWLDALLGQLFQDGVEIPLGAGINFKSPIIATRNPVTNVTDVEIPDGSVDPALLALAASGLSVPFVLRAAYSAAAAGTADDVTVTAAAPFQFRILDIWVRTSTAIAASTIQLRTATGGGGSTLSDAISTGAVGMARTNSGSGFAILANQAVYARRSDRGVAGAIHLLCERA